MGNKATRNKNLLPCFIKEAQLELNQVGSGLFRGITASNKEYLKRRHRFSVF